MPPPRANGKNAWKKFGQSLRNKEIAKGSKLKASSNVFVPTAFMDKMENNAMTENLFRSLNRAHTRRRASLSRRNNRRNTSKKLKVVPL
jgi:hypothetical protein